MTAGDPGHAPERVVLALAALLPVRRWPTRSPEEEREAVLAQARLTADTIWREAYFAGQVYQRSIEPVRVWLCSTCPQLSAVKGEYPPGSMSIEGNLGPPD